MPWNHCGATLPDTVPCPACGVLKSEWTIRTDQTRTLRVGKSTKKVARRDAWIEVALHDAAGAPMAGAAYRIALPNGRVVTGQLDAEGKARVEELAPGTCDVAFPDHLPEGQERATNARHEFRAGGVTLDVVLRTSRGEPIEHHDFVVRDAAGREVGRGTTDADGVARAAVPADGDYAIELVQRPIDAEPHAPTADHGDWAEVWSRAT